MKGYIKIHRKFRDWEWYSEPVVKDVFLHLLITASWEDSRYKGHEIKAGQTIITVSGLASELGVSTRQVRTAVEKLESTGEITRKTTNRFTVVTVENWSLYQADYDDDDKQMTNKRQTDDKQMTNGWQTDDKRTLYKEYKKTRIQENNNSACARVSHGDGVSIKKFIPPEVQEVRAYCMERGNDVDPERFVDFYEAKGWMVGKNKMKDWRAAVRNWERNGASKSAGQVQQEGRLDWIDEL